MTDISIPSSVTFFTERWTPTGTGKNRYDYRAYCFRHAVTRAVSGEHIKTKLVDEYDIIPCDDCKDLLET